VGLEDLVLRPVEGGWGYERAGLEKGYLSLEPAYEHVHIEIVHPVEPLILLLTCLFIVQGLQRFAGVGGGGEGSGGL
jgi:hypothetical protein